MLNLFLWRDYKGKQSQITQSDGHRSEPVGIWDNVFGSFVTPTDTLANWIVAAFTIVAVILVWRTLIATQKMARDTQRIGEAQVRAYLSIERVMAEIVSQDSEAIFVRLYVSINNSGQSPARNVVMRVSGPNVEHFDAAFGLGTIPANSKLLDQTIRVNLNYNASDAHRHITIHVEIKVGAKDVFDQPIEIDGLFRGGTDAAVGEWAELHPVETIVVTVPDKKARS